MRMSVEDLKDLTVTFFFVPSLVESSTEDEAHQIRGDFRAMARCLRRTEPAWSGKCHTFEAESPDPRCKSLPRAKQKEIRRFQSFAEYEDFCREHPLDLGSPSARRSGGKFGYERSGSVATSPTTLTLSSPERPRFMSSASSPSMIMRRDKSNTEDFNPRTTQATRQTSKAKAALDVRSTSGLKPKGANIRGGGTMGSLREKRHDGSEVDISGVLANVICISRDRPPPKPAKIDMEKARWQDAEEGEWSEYEKKRIISLSGLVVLGRMVS